MSWIDRIFSKGTSSSASRKANVPEGVWTKCTSCEQVLYGEEVNYMFAQNAAIICALMLVSAF